MKTTEALRIIAQLAQACAQAIEAGESELPADAFSAPAHEALDALYAAVAAAN